VIAGREGYRAEPILDVFHEKLQLKDGEWIVQIITNKEDVNLPFFSVKKRKIDVIDYPLLTLAALKKEGSIRLAVSGLCDFPFRSKPMEEVLNNQNSPVEARIEEAIKLIPGNLRDDWIASAEYRLFVLKTTLQDMFSALGGE